MKASSTNTGSSLETPEFSLVLGGPLFHLLVRSRLSTPVHFRNSGFALRHPALARGTRKRWVQAV
jgi:hypothetical protein